MFSNSARRITSAIGDDVWCEQRLQLVELDLGRVVPLKPGGSFELHDCRVESAVLVVWRAEVAQSDVRLIEQPLLRAQRSGATFRYPARP